MIFELEETGAQNARMKVSASAAAVATPSTA